MRIEYERTLDGGVCRVLIPETDEDERELDRMAAEDEAKFRRENPGKPYTFEEWLRTAEAISPQH